MAGRIVDVMARPFHVHGHQVVIGASVGLAVLAPGETDAAEMLRRADVALYRSKNAGRSCFSWFEDGMFAALDERRLLETDLRRALLLDQFELAYKSQFDFGSNSVAGFEALLRWRHRDRGLVSPANFIPIAVDTAEIFKIGAWVLLEACRTAATWLGHVTIAALPKGCRNRPRLAQVADGPIAALGGGPRGGGHGDIHLPENVCFLRNNGQVDGG